MFSNMASEQRHPSWFFFPIIELILELIFLSVSNFFFSQTLLSQFIRSFSFLLSFSRKYILFCSWNLFLLNFSTHYVERFDFIYPFSINFFACFLFLELDVCCRCALLVHGDPFGLFAGKVPIKFSGDRCLEVHRFLVLGSIVFFWICSILGNITFCIVSTAVWFSLSVE